jgi:hypothetical protein
MINLFALKANVDLEIEASKKESTDTFRCGMLLAEIVSEALEQQIAADVVVRCKDCIYRNGPEDTCGNIYCRLHDGRFDKDGYCSYGKKENE